MGFTALDGLMMGTRCGNLDPGVILYLMQFKNMNYQQIEKLLYKESGLLGVSGISGNMQTLLDSKSSHAKEAIDLFVYRITRELGALVSVLNGLDMLVFTGGIGEHASKIREAVCQNMTWLGLNFDSERNKSNLSVISQPQSKVEVRIIPTDEEWIIANHTHNLCQKERKYG
jgi:acetate kinase